MHPITGKELSDSVTALISDFKPCEDSKCENCKLVKLITNEYCDLLLTVCIDVTLIPYLCALFLKVGYAIAETRKMEETFNVRT